MTAQHWRFEPLDTWFFRESRPFNSIGGAHLKSRFPPPARTIAGVVRTAIGEAIGVDWQRFNNGEQTVFGDVDLRAEIGDAQSTGKLKIAGPYLLKNGERLYPAPLLLLSKDDIFARLAPGEPAYCDLGRVRLPVLQSPLPGAQPFEGVWLTSAGMEQALSGGTPAAGEVWRSGGLFQEETRLGIARDNRHRSNQEGLLYQTRHVRPLKGLAVSVEVSGIAPCLHPANGLLRMGGEGRLAAFYTAAAALPRLFPHRREDSQGLLLALVTPADFNGNWAPPNFAAEARKDGDVWCGVIRGVKLTIVSAIVGKMVREGGWDVAQSKPRDLRSLAPAGSCYFCEVEGDPCAALEALQGCHVGLETELGRGEVAAGCW